MVKLGGPAEGDFVIEKCSCSCSLSHGSSNCAPQVFKEGAFEVFYHLHPRGVS